MTMLREVLARFEQQTGSVSLPQMARELGIDRAMLQEMIDYWVRKGRLRASSTPDCPTCGCAKACPFVTTLPRSYELATADNAESASGSACAHCVPVHRAPSP